MKTNGMCGMQSFIPELDIASGAYKVLKYTQYVAAFSDNVMNPWWLRIIYLHVIFVMIHCNLLSRAIVVVVLILARKAWVPSIGTQAPNMTNWKLFAY